ncbi:uncharacterized protein LACBIDRAFT_331707 [Laccaria bicolor S238N-H82]|uniref:Predicted protein n=1 Tax=Laccaria bicolor (strain S238N-H82 / ATCC MYA-4686) TaxID=486041 RepID=B0DQB3_LACBS|nr:uncharacterized protein LACBIDRAFT_331707 [Laccaria bicolor S238N-H82]EDR03263.1 predicted protein [Laccaria bicolor S238N-H82]|eukprot:XP_001886059.1 predicted protein [Laccaria bicolor S238N-H82]
MSIREAESEPLFGNVRLILDSIFAISLGLASPVITGGFTKQSKMAGAHLVMLGINQGVVENVMTWLGKQLTMRHPRLPWTRIQDTSNGKRDWNRIRSRKASSQRRRRREEGFPAAQKGQGLITLKKKSSKALLWERWWHSPFMSLGTSAMTTEGRRAHALRNQSQRAAIRVDRRYLEKRESHFGSFTGTDKLRDTPFGYMVAGDVVVRVLLADRGARLRSRLNTEVRLRRDELWLVVKCDILQNVVAEDRYVFPAMVPSVAGKRPPTRATNMALWEGEVQGCRST